MKHIIAGTLLLLALPPLMAGGGDGAGKGKKDHASASLAPKEITGKPGDTVKVKLTLALDKDWHAYDMEQGARNGDKVGPNPMEISVRSAAVTLGSIKAPPSHIQYDSTFEVSIGLYDGNVVFEVPVIIKPAAAAGRTVDTLTVLPQLCNEAGICTYPEFYLPLPVKVVAGGGWK